MVLHTTGIFSASAVLEVMEQNHPFLLSPRIHLQTLRETCIFVTPRRILISSSPMLLLRKVPFNRILAKHFTQYVATSALQKNRHQCTEWVHYKKDNNYNRCYNAVIVHEPTSYILLVQRQQVGSVLKTMNVEPKDSDVDPGSASEPLPKRRRHH